MEQGGSVAVIEDVTDQREAEAASTIWPLRRAYRSRQRVHFRERVERILPQPREVCGCVTDLDQFKQVTTPRPPARDMLLRAVAER